MGFVIYLYRFILYLSEVYEPLRRLLDKEMQWHWLPKHDMAMKDNRVLVMEVPVLRCYDMNKLVTKQSDSNQTGLGCSLVQEGQPVTFASRTLTQTEQNYTQIEQESLSNRVTCH